MKLHALQIGLKENEADAISPLKYACADTKAPRSNLCDKFLYREKLGRKM